MKTIRILNLYACLGGNRYKWDEVAKEANVNIEVILNEFQIDIIKKFLNQNLHK